MNKQRKPIRIRRLKKILPILRQIKIGGYDSITILRVLTHHDFNYTMLYLYAAAMAYSFFLSIFPSFVLLFALLPYIFNTDDANVKFLDWLTEFLPIESVSLVKNIITDLFERKSIITVIFYLVILLFFATRGIHNTIDALNLIGQSKSLKKESYWHELRRSIFLFFALFIIVLVGVFVIVTGEIILHEFFSTVKLIKDVEYSILITLNWLLELFLIMLGVTFMYAFAPADRRPWRFFTPGTVIVSVLILLAQLILRFYFVNFSAYNKLYGSIGAVMMLMVWFFWNSFAFLIGFRLDALLQYSGRRSRIEPIVKPKVTFN